MIPMSEFVVALARTTRVEIAIAALLVSGGMAMAAHAAEAGNPAGPATTAVPGLFDTLDANKDRMLSRQEFQAGYAGLQRLVAMQARLHEHFGVLDANRSGAIDASEYANLELIRSQGKAAPALSTFDADHDQKLDFAEYTALVRKLATTRPPSEK
jgi:hypothetical protein